jgi:uncharacterized protein
VNKDDSPEGIRIAPAKYGLGLYTTRVMVAEEVLGRVEGEIICDPHYQSDYAIELYDDYSLEPAAPFRYLNHACDPNCQFTQYDIVNDDDEILRAEILVETLRPIMPGEQLTIDYAWPASGAIPCGCESHNCRGWVVAEEELVDLEPTTPEIDFADTSAA